MYLFMIMKETIQQNFESGVCDFLSSHLTQPILLHVELRGMPSIAKENNLEFEKVQLYRTAQSPILTATAAYFFSYLV